MKIKWKVDPVANKLLWEDLSSLPKELMGKTEPKVVVDLGGGTGDFASILMEDNVTVITLDADRSVLRKKVEGVQAVLGDGKALPFKDESVDAVTARAILHHFPEQIGQSLEEVRRVLRKGGLFLTQEPLEGNFFANGARKLVLTERHEGGEKPLDHTTLRRAVESKFRVIWQDYHFLISYLFPHLVCRLPDFLKPAARRVTKIARRFDVHALRNMEKLQRYAAYMSILGQKD